MSTEPFKFPSGKFLGLLAVGTSLSVSAALACSYFYSRKFRLALPGYGYSFPRDHFAHKQFHTEWWYHTGHLSTADGDQFGYELTFFRRAIKNPLEALITLNKDIYFAHFAMTDKKGKRFAYFQRINARPFYRADADESRLCITNGPWSLTGNSGELFLKAGSKGYDLHLRLAPLKPPVVHGHDGISQKADGLGRSSHYISMTRLDTTGTITFAGKQHKVIGASWMDHEFGSNQLTEKQCGWDWWSVQLDNHTEYMFYLMRNSDGTHDHNSSGTIIFADGSTKHIPSKDFSVTATGSWKSSKSGGTYPMGWVVRIPGLQTELGIKPIVDDQELAALNSKGISYWEGACDVDARISGNPVRGNCYAELIGYAEPLPRDI